MAKPLLLLLTLLATASADSIIKKARSDVSMKALHKQAKMHMDAQAGARRLSTTPAPSPWGDDDDFIMTAVSPRAPSSPSPSTYRE